MECLVCMEYLVCMECLVCIECLLCMECLVCIECLVCMECLVCVECPVCMEEMKPPKKIFQCSNGHVICEHCKNNPEVRVYKVNGPFVKYQLIFVPGAQLSNL